MKNLSLKAKKGFSLIELLVVIAIIGILSAVGITTYSGYTANAKKQATTAMYSQIVSLLNAETAKCASGSGNYVFTDSGATTAVPCADSSNELTAADVAEYFNDDLGMKNPYKTDQNAVRSGDPNATSPIGVSVSSGAWTIKADIDGNATSTYTANTGDKSITTAKY